MSNMDRDAFGATLRSARKAAGLSQSALGTEMANAGLGTRVAQAISAWENGEYLPPQERRTEICQWLQERLGIPDRLLERYAGILVEPDDRVDQLAAEVTDLREQVDKLSGLPDRVEELIRLMQPPNGRG